MNRTIPSLVTTTLVFLISLTAQASDSGIIKKVDWPQFLERFNPIWHKLPTKWEEAPFLGNGWMGTMVFRSRDQKNELLIQAQHAAVNDHRVRTNANGSIDGSGPFLEARFLIGDFVVKTTGEMTNCDLKLDLWNAELIGTIHTTKGDLGLRAFVHTKDMVTQVELSGPGAEGAKIEFLPGTALSPRAARRKDPEHTPLPENCLPLNPPYDFQEKEGVHVCHQGLVAGGEYATAWSSFTQRDKIIFRFSIAQSYPSTTAVTEAVASLKNVDAIPQQEWIETHRTWWHRIYQRSFLSFSDPYWEAFYWIQRYKMAAATRSDRALIDNHGPWMETTSWPYATWNLNVQLSYWPYNAAGLADLAASLPNHLRNCSNALINNVASEYRDDSAGLGLNPTESLICSVGACKKDPSTGQFDFTLPPAKGDGPDLGDLTWGLHDCWLQYRYTMNKDLLCETIYPLLRRSINYYRHFLVLQSDGYLHLPKAGSPEYGQGGPDCNYDLGLIRWGCHALLDANERLKLNDPLAPKWQEILEKLAPYPTDQNGLMIAAGVPQTFGHRHFSHMLMIYPLYQLTTDKPKDRELIEKSVTHWLSFNSGFAGYTYTGAASIYASLGDGERALNILNGLRPHILPNALYREGGPCIETPLSAAQSIHDMLLQSWGGTIRVFPALPGSWHDAVFMDLRTEGAFSVSASSSKGKTGWVRVKSLAGEPMLIHPNIEGTPQITGSGATHVTEKSQGLYALKLAKGEEVTFATNSVPFVVEPVADPIPYRFGLP